MISDQLKKQRAAKRRRHRRRTPRNYTAYQEFRQTEQMLLDSRQQWWDTEISKLERAPQNEKWKIPNRLTDHGFHMLVQPVKVGDKYVFQNREILTEMEKLHVSEVSDGIHVKPLMHNHIIKDWFEQAQKEINIHDSDLEITHDEVARTFETSTNTPGPDGVTAMMIDKAASDCLHRLWSKVWLLHKIQDEVARDFCTTLVLTSV